MPKTLKVCKHGNRQSWCETCVLEAEVAALKAERDEALAEEAGAQAALNVAHEQYDELVAERDALKAEIEQLRVQLAGCGVAAIENMESSKANRAKRGDYGWSESYYAVCCAVDREIELRAKLAELSKPTTDTPLKTAGVYTGSRINYGPMTYIVEDDK